MDIVFESYTTVHATVHSRLPFRACFSNSNNLYNGRLGQSSHFEGTQTRIGVFRSALPAPRVLFSDVSGAIFRGELKVSSAWSSDAAPAPDVSIYSANLPDLTGSFEASITRHGNYASGIGLRSLLSDAAAVFRSQLPLKVYFSDGAVRTDRVAFLIQQPEIYSTMSPGVTRSLSDGMVSRDTPNAEFIHALMDLMRASESYSAHAEALLALLDQGTMSDVASMILQLDLLDSFIASQVVTGTAQVTVFLADGMQASDVGAGLSDVLAALRDGFYATITLSSGEDVWTAWVMSPSNKAMRTYSNFPFNSFAILGGQFLGASDAGIYRMGGNTDAGEAIRSAIRTGALNFGTMDMKTVPLVYIGATVSGDLLLRVQATTIKGIELQQTYRMVPAAIGVPREHSVEPGRGFRSVYWTFELCNDTDGADFEVHAWNVVPITHTGKLK